MRKAILLSAAVYFLIAGLVYADTLIYNNSFTSGYYYNPGAYREIFDFGTSPGGRVSKFSFEYVEGSTTTGTILVRFYSGTNRSTYDPGEQLKLVALTFVPGTNGNRGRLYHS